MRIRIEDAECQGHALCAMNAPDLIDTSEQDGHAVALVSEVPPELVPTARLAELGCPERAIVLED
ncbi:conserved hypothetical protein [Frankia canadensis]|uniref:Ferredoxin n=1 Tax=Frankia canadensis TaxID=1836972 RepID=A0A2I2KW67_9ACTN|nr:ferredoxin [Frankia canadensis]SNQ49909.1 conserved hypothetical protein [Frankia canadensis]SOU57199.1 conserved hypothetical protein [Frankia canadensis]